ncbi:MAG: GNAT family N-acetyltransferase, partial [Campylobacteraceae bacterium]|nr:GNAT family N-acetyltransferase [Campylobacteraceae bacterium]
SLPKGAQNLIIYYYNLYYGIQEKLVLAKEPFVLTKNEKEEMENIFQSNDKQKDFVILKEQLDCYGANVPVLYKQYTELCDDVGVRFLEFSIDKNFNNCVDSFLLVDISKIKEKKRKRYINVK